MPIQVRFAGQTWRTDDLTIDEAIKLQEVTGKTWLTISPHQSALDAKAVLAAFLAREMGQEAADQKVGALTVSEMLECISQVANDLPDYYEDGLPKAEGESSTGSSSTAPENTDGPPA